MFLHVVEARYVREYTVWLHFNDGASGEVDLSAVLQGPVFEPLKDVTLFKRFSIVGHTIAWENGADLAPEYLQELTA